MGFTTESMPAPPTARALEGPSDFDLPVKEFIGYDPKGTTSITGSPLVQKTKPEANTINRVSESEDTINMVPEEESVTLSSKVSAIARRDQAQRAREKK